ncbi:MAG: U32 family peptidase [Deltaproteobacteria bacterium]|nr:U32 family peptidase [Deltaproteobacteria bacterium]
MGARPPEVLAPAGGRPQLRAAIEAGADAVYFGLTRFNARARAANFAPEELADIMGTLHERGVMGFVTVNTLVYDEELDDVAQLLEHLAACKVDAAIVQDLGLTALARQVAPALPLHGSTQMTVTSAESARLVGRLGLERVVLGRELSVREIREVVKGTDLEVEVFVHGALCVSYSGQCFSSEAWGGRSANRGQCAQACRLPYDMLVDGKREDLGELRYLLSPQDLAGIHHVPALMEAGVSCFKIEGRLKGPEYVAATTAAYRRAVDSAWEGRELAWERGDQVRLEQVYSRGLTPGFLDGPRHQRLVQGRFPRHRGVRTGEVIAVAGRGVTVSLQGPIKAGDGVVFDAGRAEEAETGGVVFQVLRNGAPVQGEVSEGQALLLFGRGFDADPVSSGDKVWRTKDATLRGTLEPMWSGAVHRRSPVSARVTGAPGRPLTLRLVDDAGRAVTVHSEQLLQEARGKALDEGVLRAQLGRLGGTVFTLDALDVDLDGACFLAVSALNRLRRAAAEQLLAVRHDLRVRDVTEPDSATPVRVALTDPPRRCVVPTPTEPVLTVLCRSPEQVDAALALPEVAAVAVDYLEVKGLGGAIERVKAAGKEAIAVSPRVLKPTEENLRAFLLKLGADAILVRSLGLLESLLSEQVKTVPALYGDFSLNCTNATTRDLLLDAGLTRLAPGHDLNAAQLAALVTPDTAGRLELIVHHHLPIFHTEHCVFARFLSEGDNRSNCGAPCEHHEVHLQGRDGKRHLVRADMGCRNTVFNADAQSGLRNLTSFLDAGFRRFRIELADHQAADVAPLVRAYSRALSGEVGGLAAWRGLESSSRYGLTTGSLRIVNEPVTVKTPGWVSQHG